MYKLTNPIFDMSTYAELRTKFKELFGRKGRGSIKAKEVLNLMIELLDKLFGIDVSATATIRKSYDTLGLANADKNPLDPETQKPIKIGQLISVVADPAVGNNAICRLAALADDGTPTWERQAALGDMTNYTKSGGSNKTAKDLENDLAQLAGEIGVYKERKNLYNGTPYSSSALENMLYMPIMKNEGNITVSLSDYSNYKFRFIGSDTDVGSGTTPATPFYTEEKTLDVAEVLEKPFLWVQVMRVDSANLTPDDVQLYLHAKIGNKIDEISAAQESIKELANIEPNAVNIIPNNIFKNEEINFWLKQPAYANLNVLISRKPFANAFSNYSLEIKGNYPDGLSPKNAFFGVYSNIDDICSEGDTIVFKGLVFPTQPGTTLTFRFRNASNATLYSRPTTYLATGEWNEVKIEEVVPAGAAFVNIYVSKIPLGTSVYLAAWDVHKKIDSKLYPQITTDVENTGKEEELSTAYIDSKNGDDNNSGDVLSPLKTISKGIALKKKKLIVRGGIYRETIDLSLVDDIKIYGKVNETVRVLGSERVENFTLVSGKTNVYSAPYSGVITASKKVIYEDGRQDKEILQKERHSLQKSLTHRMPYSVISEIPFNTDLQTTLTDLENSPGKYYHDGSTLYIHATDSDNPNTNGYSYENAVRAGLISGARGVSSVEINNIGVYFSNTYGANFSGCASVKRNFFIMMGAANNGIQDTSNFVITYNDEVADTRDGIAGTNAITDNSRETGNATYIGTWSHDNTDDGTSHHGKSNIKTIGCLFEYNGKSGIAPSNTSQWTDQNSLCRKNGGNPSFPQYGEGVQVVNPVQSGDIGVGVTFVGYGTICEGNRIGFGARNVDSVSVTLYNCTSRNNEFAEYYADGGKMYLRNCKVSNSDISKHKVQEKTGIIEVENDSVIN